MTGHTRRLTFLTQWFAPEPTAPPVWIAEAMRDLGWEATVVTGIPNYPDGVVKDGYRAWRPVKESRDGMPVVRTPLFPSHDQSPGRRILNYLSWAISSTLLAARVIRRSDVVLVYSSPPTAALAAVTARIRHRVPFVLLIQDLWPDSIFAAGFMTRPAIRRLVEPPVARFVQWTYGRAAAIAVISPGMKTRLIERGVAAEKVHVVYNWVDEKVFAPAQPDGALREFLGIPRGELVFLYAGNIGAAQGLGTLVDAFAHAAEANHLVLVGDGIEKAALSSRAASASNIHFKDPMPIHEMTALQSDADVMVVSLTDHPLFEITLPSKTQASLAAGRAVLAVAQGDVATVVRDAGAGVAARPGDTQSVVQAVAELAALSREERLRLGQNAREYYEREMSRSVGAARLSALLEAAATNRPARTSRRSK